MRRSVWGMVAGLVLAMLGAAAVAKSFGLPLVDSVTGELPIWHLLRTALPVAAFALPGALAAILISETWRVRGPLYWLSAGVILALLAHITLTSGDASSVATFKTTPAFNTILGMGVVGGLVYWLTGGRSAGALSAAIAHSSRAVELDERGLRKRCRLCTVLSLALGLLPLGLIGWHMMSKPSLISPAQLVEQTAADGSKRLADEGLPWAKLTIEDHVGKISGTVADASARTAAFEKSKAVLEPMVGLPGVVAYLQNDIKVADAAKPAAVVEKPVDTSAKLKPADELKLAVEAKKKADEAATKSKEASAKRKADEAAAKAKAEEDARVAAEAKRKADEAAAKAKAEEDARVAAEAKRKADEAAAKARAEEEVRVAAEAKRKADEAAAKAKAEEDARVAAEAKRKADEAAAKAKAEEDARVAAEAKRKADEAAAKAKAEDEARFAAEAKRKADEAVAKAADAAKVAAAAVAAAPAPAAPAVNPAPPAQPASPAPTAQPEPPRPVPSASDAQCVSDFSDAFRASTIRFAFGGSRLDPTALDAVERYAAVAKRCGGFSLTIGGHADRSGAAAVNLAVSQSRADRVRKALIARGVPAERLKAMGYGAERPFDLARTRAANRMNRRVEIAAGPTPAAKPAAATAAPTPVTAPATPPVAPAAPAPIAVVPQLPADQCNAEFSRAFSSETIRFIGASAIVSDGYADLLDRIANLALACPTHRLSIGGHTDRRGNPAYNASLSVERAEAVRDALIDRDVPAARLTTNGYGGDRPFDPANTPAAYALNRRVDFGASVAVPKSQ